MTTYEQLLKDFDLEIGEEFAYNNANYIVEKDSIYKKVPRLILNKVGLTDSFLYDYDLAKELILDMLLGRIKKVKKWIPKMYESYYCPYLRNHNLYDHFIWYDNAYDKHCLEKGLVCKTKEEAQRLAKKMLEAIND